MKLKAVFSSLILSIGVSAANAELREFRFYGYVDQASPTAPKGAIVTGSFAYDTKASPQLQFGQSSGPGYGGASYPVPRGMTIRVNGSTIVSERANVDVVNNFGGNVEDSISVYGQPMTINGTTFENGSLGIYLASGPGRNQVLRDTSLPRSINVQRYNGMNYGWVQVDGSPDGSILSFVILHVTGR